MGDRHLKKHGGGDVRSEAVEASADGIAVLEGGEYVYVNEAYADLHGYDGPEELIGDSWRTVYGDEEAERLEDEAVPAADEDGEWRGEVTGRRADGTEFLQEVSLARVEDRKVVCVTRDVTDEKKRKRELEKYEAFVENSSESVTHMDEDGTILFRSPSSEREKDEPDRMTGNNGFEYVHPEDRERVVEKYRELLGDPERKTDTVEYRSERADGTYEWVEAVATDQRDTEVGGVVVNTRVIDDRKQREEELERYEAFVENSSDMVAHLSEDGELVYLSPSSERIMERGPEERIGEDAFEYIHPEDREHVMELFESPMDAGEERQKVEFRSRDGDGNYVWLEARGTDRRDTDLGGFVVNIRDISERKKREEELERYEAFVKSTSDVVTHIDESGEVVYNSPSIEEIFGYEKGEIAGENAFEYIHPNDREKMMKEFESILNGDDVGGQNTEFRVRGADGDYVWVEDAGGNPADNGLDGIVLNLRDITERKKREEELERYEAFLENSLDIFSVLDEVGRHVYNSPSVERILGYDREEHTGEYSLDYVHPDDEARTREWFESLVEGDKEINETELRYRDADGSYVWFEVIGTDRTEEVGGVIFNARDITERKKREEELREEKQAMDTVLSNVPVIVFTLDEGGFFTRSQGKSLNRIGLDPGEMVGESVFEVYGERQDITEEIEKALSGERVQTTVEVEGRIFESWYEPLKDESGEASGIVGMAYDVTEREKREKELERYEAFVENSSDVVTLVEEDGTVVYFSPSVEYHTEHTQEERVGDNIYEYVHPDDRERVMETYSRLLEESETGIVEEEFRYQSGDGTYIWVEASGTDQRDTDLGGIVVNARDITERKRRERELERYEAFVENSSDLIVHLDESGELLYESPGTQEIFGHEPGINLGENVFQYIHPEDRERVLERFDEGLRGSESTPGTIEARFEDADGDYVWLEAVGTDQRTTEVGGVIVSLRDISERKERERELEKYKTFVENSRDIVVHLDEDGTVMYHSPSVQRILGHSQDERIGENAFEYVHPDDRERVVELFTTVTVDEEVDSAEAEFRAEHADGGYVWFEGRGHDQRDTEVGGFVVNARDITERKKRERRLVEAESRYRALVDDFPEGAVFLFDEELRYTIAGGTELDEIGLSPEDIEGKTLHEVFPDEAEDHEVYYRKALEGEEACFENRYDGDVYRVWTVPVRDDDGDIFAGIAFSQNITERKERQKELERYEEIIENTSDVITLIDRDGTILYQSPSVEKNMGYGQYERVGENGFEYIHPEDRERAVEAFQSVVGNPERETAEAELRFLRANGEYVWLEARGTDRRDTDLGGFVVTTRDISERKKREEELRRNRELLRQTEMIADTGGWEYDVDTQEVRWTQGTFDIHDVTPEFEPTVDSVVELYHPDDRDSLRQVIQRCVEEGVPYEDEFRIRDTDDELRWIRTNGEPVFEDGDVVKVRGAVQDVTERKKREESLRRSRELLGHTEKIADTGGWEYEVEEQELRWTEGTYEIHGISQDFELTPEKIGDLYHPEDSEELGRLIQRCINEGEPYEKEFRVTQLGGDTENEDGVRWLRTNGVPIQNDGEVVKIRGAVKDITEQKERERDLRRNRELLRHAERISNTGGWEYEVEEQELRWTEGTYEIHGVDKDRDIEIGEGIEFFHGESKNEIKEAVERCRDKGEPYDKELRLSRADGSLIWVRTLGEPVFEEGEVVKLRGAIQDITERKEREREIKEQKDQIDFFNSLLRHDMLNSMTVIRGSADILLDELPEDDDRHELAERISKHSTEIVELTERVRSVLRRLTEEGETEMAPTEITDVVEERVESLKETYPEAECVTETPKESRVMADPFLNHVIDNVLVNAVEHNDKEKPRVEVTVEDGNNTATVRVADNGPGIPDDEEESVFEQGTTGRSSGSVGFGLYYVEQMLSEYGGDIYVEDNEPEGAVFVMEIPKAGHGLREADKAAEGD
jgi:PAS domain S-box-containing protein